ncbi:Gfo/Idh/MocA family protein [Paracoccus saliphilus]|uniref:Gfo/Idh/MocA family oxidoreductase n=1 Tax=Paracoccus saliphilus TaxID=405559 RepID=A0AA45W6B3_9RHOB|nr:Gfo/Idh/MocA family oxidoreductase [Paracoccus saliphilus]WCR01495.1 Gfo/Idh/MocA family oxidoreductase [Paracoccus saliphilus]SIS99648.1 Predicted dehydrogenase [Paracoccus saliphilus]
MAFPNALPASRIPDAMQAPALRWGILGSGWIAEQFIRSVRAHTRQEIAAVGSRNLDKASAFARNWGITHAYGSYEELAADDSLDVIYVATPHNMHHVHVLLALNAGRNVLVEKPIALDHAQAAEMVAVARRKKLFLCEALWTYFLPKFDVLQQIFDAGILGEIKSVHTEYGEYFTRDHRIFNPSLAGGPLLDLGTYPISLLSKLLGPAEQMVGLKQQDPSGVHGQLSIAMANAAGNQGSMSTTLYGLTPTNAAIVGTEATIRFGSEFNLPGPFELISANGSASLHYAEPAGRHFEGLYFEAAEVARCIAEGHMEAGQRPLAATLEMMRMLDEIRRVLDISWSQ